MCIETFDLEFTQPTIIGGQIFFKIDIQLFLMNVKKFRSDSSSLLRDT